ncbi:DNA recombinase, partial [Escherichia coli]|nr:DNA recombinase [Escherichia coli]MDA6322709.1 DNA recombinase [Escherichia coli]
LPSEIMIWQPEFTDKILSRKPGAVQMEKAQLLCDEMAQAENMDDLKRYFAEAYRLTSGMKLQQNVQAIYIECKAKLEVASEQTI